MSRVYGGPDAYRREQERQAELRKRPCPVCYLRALLIENASGRRMCPRCLGAHCVALIGLDVSIPGLTAAPAA